MNNHFYCFLQHVAVCLLAGLFHQQAGVYGNPRKDCNIRKWYVDMLADGHLMDAVTDEQILAKSQIEAMLKKAKLDDNDMVKCDILDRYHDIFKTKKQDTIPKEDKTTGKEVKHDDDFNDAVDETEFGDETDMNDNDIDTMNTITNLKEKEQVSKELDVRHSGESDTQSKSKKFVTKKRRKRQLINAGVYVSSLVRGVCFSDKSYVLQHLVETNPVDAFKIKITKLKSTEHRYGSTSLKVCNLRHRCSNYCYYTTVFKQLQCFPQYSTKNVTSNKRINEDKHLVNHTKELYGNNTLQKLRKDNIEEMSMDNTIQPRDADKRHVGEQVQKNYVSKDPEPNGNINIKTKPLSEKEPVQKNVVSKDPETKGNININTKPLSEKEPVQTNDVSKDPETNGNININIKPLSEKEPVQKNDVSKDPETKGKIKPLSEKENALNAEESPNKKQDRQHFPYPDFDFVKFEQQLTRKANEYETKIQSLEIMIIRLENKLLAEKLTQHNDTGSFTRLENQILKVENELLKLNQSYFHLREENEMLKKRQGKYLELAYVKSQTSDQTNITKQNEIISQQHLKISHLKTVLQNHSDMFDKFKRKHNLLEEQNQILHQIVMNQTAIISNIMKKMQEIADDNNKQRQDTQSLKAKFDLQATSTHILEKLEHLVSDKIAAVANDKKDRTTERKDNTLHISQFFPHFPTPLIDKDTKWQCQGNKSPRFCLLFSIILSPCPPFAPIYWSKCPSLLRRMSVDMSSVHSADISQKKQQPNTSVKTETESKTDVDPNISKAHTHFPSNNLRTEQETKEKKYQDQNTNKKDEKSDRKDTKTVGKDTKQGVKDNKSDKQNVKMGEQDTKEGEKDIKMVIKDHKMDQKDIKTDEKIYKRDKKDVKVGEKDTNKDEKGVKKSNEKDQKIGVKDKKLDEKDIKMASKVVDGSKKEVKIDTLNDKMSPENTRVASVINKENSQKVVQIQAESKKEYKADSKESAASVEKQKQISAEKPHKILYPAEWNDKPKDCYSLYESGHSMNKMYRVYLPGVKEQIPVLCDMRKGGWTIILKRLDGSVDFNRDWDEYKEGFGGIYTEHWIGNDNLHYLTNQDHYKLRVEITDWERQRRFAEYDFFWVEGEEANYRIHVGGYSGDAGDGFLRHSGMMFSTYDKDNDLLKETQMGGSCAKRFKAGGWFYRCYNNNLFGIYYHSEKIPERHFDGITWKPWKGPNNSMKEVILKIRPRNARDL